MAVLLVVVTIKLIICKLSPSVNQQPFFNFFRFYCQQLALKVNKDKNSNGQRRVAGFIATLITITPLVIIVWLFEEFIAVPFIWQAILLFIALGTFNLNHVSKEIAKNIAAQDKYQAKQLLSPWLSRDCEQLSPIGISKACIEMLLLRKLQQQFIVCFYFIFIGPLAALTFRLILETHYSWNIKHHQFSYFGRFINKTVNMLQWFPSRIFLLLLIFTSINQPILLFWRLIKTLFFKLDNSIVIAYLSYVLSLKLGGVAMYSKYKVRRLSFNDQGQQPQAKNIIAAIKQLNLVFMLACGILVSIITMIAILINHL
ncbi:MAG: cobalamin biosynthesis protein [Colwelliaceae bacterium]|nr:cobalamin biosynthesis protein [Colwelliaceae bacterium]